MSKIQTLMTELRRMPIYKQLIPMEAGIGWPTPVRKRQPDGTYKVYGTLLLFGQTIDPAGGAQLYAPFATVTLSYDDGLVVEYVNLRYSSPDLAKNASEPIGRFPHDAVQSMTRQEYLAERAELLAFFDTLFETLQRDEAPGEEWQAKFSALLSKLVEPSLLPYYREYFPKFWGKFVPAAP